MIDDVPTVANAVQRLVQALTPLYGASEAGSLTRILFEDAYGYYRMDSPQLMKKEELRHLDEVQKRLLNWEPLQYILGEADFYGLKFRVTPEVLIPRQETEELVFLTLETIKMKWGHQPEITVLDVGTGCGCIPVTLAKKIPTLQVHAIDVDPGALRVARENAKRHQVPIHFKELDVLQEDNWLFLPKIDLLISNPPYIPRREMKLVGESVQRYEPERALFVEDENEFIFYDALARLLANRGGPKSCVLAEVNEYNASKVKALWEDHHLIQVSIHQDLQGKDRMVKAEYGY